MSKSSQYFYALYYERDEEKFIQIHYVINTQMKPFEQGRIISFNTKQEALEYIKNKEQTDSTNG